MDRSAYSSQKGELELPVNLRIEQHFVELIAKGRGEKEAVDKLAARDQDSDDAKIKQAQPNVLAKFMNDSRPVDYRGSLRNDSRSSQASADSAKAEVDKAIKALGNDNFKVREKASKYLESRNSEPEVLEKIAEALSSAVPEVAHRATKLIDICIARASTRARDSSSNNFSANPSSLTAWVERFEGNPIFCENTGNDQFLTRLQKVIETTASTPEEQRQIKELGILSDIVKAGIYRERDFSKETRQAIMRQLSSKMEDIGGNCAKVLESFTVVDLNFAGVKDANFIRNLKLLEKLPNLTTLRLKEDEKSLNDTALKNIANLKNLHNLDLWGTDVTDKGLSNLAGMSKLESLNLGRTGVTDAGLEKIKNLTKMQELGLDRTAITDKGIKQLSGMKDLEYLYLSETYITDESIKQIADLKNLKDLRIAFTQLTDASVESLARLGNLRRLAIGASGITESGLDKLRAALPGCDISWFPVSPP